MTSVNDRHRFPMQSALVCMHTLDKTYCMSHDNNYQVVMISQSYYIVWALNLERIKFVLKSSTSLTYR